MKNIFDEFREVVEEVADHPAAYDTRTIHLIKELKDYFNSYVWASTEAERSFYDVVYVNMTFAEKAQELGVSESSLRVAGSRLTARLNARLFDGKTVGTVIYSKDTSTIAQAVRCVGFLNARLTPRDRFPEEIAKGTYPIEKDYGDNTEEIMRVAVLLAMYSRENIQFMLNKVDPDILSYVMKKLQEDLPNDDLFYYTCSKKLFRAAAGKMMDSMVSALKKAPDKYPDLFCETAGK